MSNSAIPACPRCGRSDSAWLVSALFSYDFKPVAQPLPEGAGRSPEAHNTAQLAQLLQAPPQPVNPGIRAMRRRSNLAGPPILIFILCMLLYFVLYDLFRDSIAACDLGCLIGLLYIGLFILLMAWQWGRQRVYNRQFPIWQRARQRWDLLRYCIRCDGIFMPGQQELAAPEGMARLVSEEQPASAVAPA